MQNLVSTHSPKLALDSSQSGTTWDCIGKCHPDLIFFNEPKMTSNGFLFFRFVLDSSMSQMTSAFLWWVSSCWGVVCLSTNFQWHVACQKTYKILLMFKEMLHVWHLVRKAWTGSEGLPATMNFWRYIFQLPKVILTWQRRYVCMSLSSSSSLYKAWKGVPSGLSWPLNLNESTCFKNNLHVQNNLHMLQALQSISKSHCGLLRNMPHKKKNKFQNRTGKHGTNV